MTLCNIITKINITFIIIILYIYIRLSIFKCLSIGCYGVTLLHSFVVLVLSVYRDFVTF